MTLKKKIINKQKRLKKCNLTHVQRDSSAHLNIHAEKCTCREMHTQQCAFFFSFFASLYFYVLADRLQ